MNDRISTQPLPDTECACASVRRAARLVTQIYDEEFAGHLVASQFALLWALEQQSRSNQSTLAKAPGLDKATLSRNLSSMARKGWIDRQTATDQRERGFRLTPGGRALLKAARPAWKRPQTRLQSSMIVEQWDQIRQPFRALTNASHRALNKVGDDI